MNEFRFYQFINISEISIEKTGERVIKMIKKFDRSLIFIKVYWNSVIF
jgi:hypothetical protein